MRKALPIVPTAPPVVSLNDVQRFSGVATIRDEVGFAAKLREIILEKAQITKAPSLPDIRAQLEHKATALKAMKTWEPSATDLQRGRVQMLKEFNTPQNLPLAQFAKLANKSRQQVYKDVAAKRLLSLSVGTRGQRIPDWQLDHVRLELTRLLLSKAANVDEWTLFHALSGPLESLHGKTPVEAVHKSNMNKVLSAVLNDLGVYD